MTIAIDRLQSGIQKPQALADTGFCDGPSEKAESDRPQQAKPRQGRSGEGESSEDSEAGRDTEV